MAGAGLLVLPGALAGGDIAAATPSARGGPASPGHDQAGDLPAATARRSAYATGESVRLLRLGGVTRYGTAAAVVRWRIDGSEIPASRRLRLVSGVRPLDAVAYGKDATPTLYLPPSGAIPASTRAAFAALRPTAIEVIGAESRLPTTQVRALVGRAAFTRHLPTDPAAVMWDRAVRSGNWGSDDAQQAMPPVAFAVGRVLAEAAVAVQVRDWHAVVVPARGPLPPPPTVSPEPAWFGQPVTVVGGTDAISTARRAQLRVGQRELGDMTFTDLERRDRYATSALVARRGYPDGARTAYLVEGLTGVDAAAAVSLVDGPVLMVPRCGPLPRETAEALAALKPGRIVAVGGAASVCNEVLTQAGAAVGAQRVTHTAVDVLGDCILSDAGGMWCWDSNPRASARAPRLVPGAESGMRMLVSSGLGQCVVSMAGELLCRSGDGAVSRVDRVPDGVVGYVSVYESGGCVVLADGRVWCHSSSSERPLTGRFADELGRVSQLTVAADYLCGVRADGSVWCTRPTTDTAGGPHFMPPTRIDVGGAPVVQIAGTQTFNLLLRSADGTVRMVGAASHDENVDVITIPVRARTLLPHVYGGLIDTDGQLQHVLGPSPSGPHEPLTNGDRQVVSADDESRWGRRVVWDDGSVSVAFDGSPGSWGVLGDGLLAPRSGPAKVLGFGP